MNTIYHENNLLPKLKRKIGRRTKVVVISLLLALVTSVIVTLILQYNEGTQAESLISPNSTLTIANDIFYDPPHDVLVKKGYFDSIGKVYVHFSSPYISYWKTLKVWMSLDNLTWVEIPFLPSTTENTSQMALLGVINLANPQFTLYQKSYIPPQGMIIPPPITPEEVSHFQANVLIRKEPTPSDTATWIVAFFSIFLGVFGAIGFVLNIYFPEKEPELEESSVRTRRRKRKESNTKLKNRAR